MAELLGDYSSMYSTRTGNDVAGGIGRTWLGDISGMNAAAEYEDWRLSEQSADNALYRDMLKLNEQNSFNAREAQKTRDFQERLSNTAYQRAVKDMKLAGINPAMLYSSGGASVPSGSSASSGSGGSTGSSNRPSKNSKDGIMALVQIIAGCLKLLA